MLLALAGSMPAALAQTKGRARQPGAQPSNKPAPASDVDDIRIRVRMSVGEQSFESVEYVKGARQRTEMSMAGGFKTIMQCDLRRYVQVNDQTRTYTVQPFAGGEGDGNEQAKTQAVAGQDAQAQAEKRRGGVVTIVNTLTDTGERKQMFGYTARRLKGVMEYEASPDACQKGGHRTESDGWYIDLKYGVDCAAASAGGASGGYAKPGCRDEIRTKTVGTAKMGYPVLLTTKSFNEDGSFTTMTREVVELSRSPLEQALFEIPEGYTEAKSYAQLAVGAGDAEDGEANVSNSNPASGADASGGVHGTASAATAALGPKKPGVVRIGVVMPSAQLGQGASGVDASMPVRNTLVQFLSSPSIEIAALEARAPQQVELEAQRKECDYVLYTGVAQKKGGGGGFGGFLKKAAPVVAAASVGVYGNQGETVAANGTTADVSSAIKAKDEITVEYKLMSASGGSTPKTANTLKAKAKTDGEDVLTPLIRQVATAVLGGVAGN
jgi:hypothetical protein